MRPNTSRISKQDAAQIEAQHRNANALNSEKFSARSKQALAIEPGMTQGQVEAIIGKPDFIRKVKDGTVWQYYDNPEERKANQQVEIAAVFYDKNSNTIVILQVNEYMLLLG